MLFKKSKPTAIQQVHKASAWLEVSEFQVFCICIQWMILNFADDQGTYFGCAIGGSQRRKRLRNKLNIVVCVNVTAKGDAVLRSVQIETMAVTR